MTGRILETSNRQLRHERITPTSCSSLADCSIEWNWKYRFFLVLNKPLEAEVAFGSGAHVSWRCSMFWLFVKFYMHNARSTVSEIERSGEVHPHYAQLMMFLEKRFVNTVSVCPGKCSAVHVSLPIYSCANIFNRFYGVDEVYFDLGEIYWLNASSFTPAASRLKLGQKLIK